MNVVPVSQLYPSLNITTPVNEDIRSLLLKILSNQDQDVDQQEINLYLEKMAFTDLKIILFDILKSQSYPYRNWHKLIDNLYQNNLISRNNLQLLMRVGEAFYQQEVWEQEGAILIEKYRIDTQQIMDEIKKQLHDVEEQNNTLQKRVNRQEVVLAGVKVSSLILTTMILGAVGGTMWAFLMPSHRIDEIDYHPLDGLQEVGVCAGIGTAIGAVVGGVCLTLEEGIKRIKHQYSWIQTMCKREVVTLQ